jgi:4,5-DOPA dioxygenase extradiol
MPKAPAIFIGHGSPMNAIEDNPFSRGWAAIAQRYEKPRAVLCVSAHWVTDGVQLTGNPLPRTIHDFGGFPAELHAVQYPAPGDPMLALQIAERLPDAGISEDWGLDHGTWSVLKHMYPDADVPVIQLSLDAKRSPQQHYEIGRALAPLRDDNILILGSGNIVHNLRHWRDEEVQPWVTAFDAFIAEKIAAREDDAVTDYRANPQATIAAPDWDHFTPLLYVLGASSGEPAEVFNQTYMPGISMTSNAFGLAA